MPELTIEQAYQLALQHHQAGRPADAQALCRQVLVNQPNHLGALHLLAAVSFHIGRGSNGEALQAIRRAIQLNPAAAEFHNDLGLALLSEAELDAAAAAFREAISRRPNFLDAQRNLAALAELAGRLGATTAAPAPVPASPAQQFGGPQLSGPFFFTEHGGIPGKAVPRPDQLPPQASADPAAQFDAANAMLAGGRLDEAIGTYRQALGIRPDYPEALANLGTALKHRGDLGQAIASYERALALRPTFAEVWSNLGEALRESGRLDEAIAAYRRAIEMRPDLPEAHNNLGIALLRTGMVDEAITSYRKALALRPSYAEAHNNLGEALSAAARLDEAEEMLRKALALRPGYPESRLGLATIQLLRGNYAEGWPAYEVRFSVGDFARWSAGHAVPGPSWDGRDLNGKRILLRAEQGLGDTIQFVRYAPLVAARGGRVTVVCDPSLVRLLSNQPDLRAEVVGTYPDPSAYDVQCPMLSLPRLFGTTLRNVPAAVPYVRADPVLVEGWRARMSDGVMEWWSGGVAEIADSRSPIAEGEKASGQTGLENPQSTSTPPLDHSTTPPLPLSVGLAWSGNPANKGDRTRSLPLLALAPLAAVPGVRFFSLQKGPPAEQARNAPPGMNVVDWTDELRDFADTAALVANLDLVIAVDTAVVHLAGAMGKRVWVLLPFAPDFRWMLDRPDSPWYPTMRLFRQPRPRAWDAPIRKVAEALAEFTKAASSSVGGNRGS